MPDLSFLAALGLSRVAAGHVPRRTTMKRSLLSVAALAVYGTIFQRKTRKLTR